MCSKWNCECRHEIVLREMKRKPKHSSQRLWKCLRNRHINIIVFIFQRSNKFFRHEIVSVLLIRCDHRTNKPKKKKRNLLNVDAIEFRMFKDIILPREKNYIQKPLKFLDIYFASPIQPNSVETECMIPRSTEQKNWA